MPAERFHSNLCRSLSVPFEPRDDGLKVTETQDSDQNVTSVRGTLRIESYWAVLALSGDLFIGQRMVVLLFPLHRSRGWHLINAWLIAGTVKCGQFPRSTTVSKTDKVHPLPG